MDPSRQTHAALESLTNHRHCDLIQFTQLTGTTVSSVLSNAQNSSTMSTPTFQLVSLVSQPSNSEQQGTVQNVIGHSHLDHQSSNNNQQHQHHQQQYSLNSVREDPSKELGELQPLPSIIEVLAEEGANEIQTQTEVVSDLPTLEQCCICSANYEKPHRIYPQPDFNRLLSKLLDIIPTTLPNGKSFFSEYVPVCTTCAKKIKKYERLRNEMDVIKQEVISSLTDSFLFIQQNNTPVAQCLKEPFLRRWVTKQNPSSKSRNNHYNNYQNGPKIVKPKKPAKVLPKEHFLHNSNTTAANKSTTPLTLVHESGNIRIVPWQLAGEVNIFTTEDANGTDTPQYATAYVSDMIDGDEYNVNQPVSSEESEKNIESSNTKNKNSIRAQIINEAEEGIKKPRGSQPAKAKQHERPPFFCQSCGRVFSILKSLRHHCSDCTEETKPQNCSICMADFSESTWLDLKFHIDLAHPNQCELDKCRHCRKEFLPNAINEHECKYESSGSLSAIKPHQELKCDFCDKIYFHTNSLGNHVRRHHLGEKTFTCEVCSRVFTATAILKSHMSIHKTEPTSKSAFKCDTCNIYCSTSWGLKQHQSVHSGIKQYQCQVCGKKFRLYQAWKTHEVVHTKERNYCCEICGKLFSLYSTKQRHLRRHNNPLPELPKRGESCPICGNVRLFIKLSVLKRHMLREHPGTKEQFEICRRAGNEEEDVNNTVNQKRAAKNIKSPRNIRRSTSTSKSSGKQTPIRRKSQSNTPPKPRQRKTSTVIRSSVDEIDSDIEILVKGEPESDEEMSIEEGELEAAFTRVQSSKSAGKIRTDSHRS